MTDHGYQKTHAEHCVFVKKFDGGVTLLMSVALSTTEAEYMAIVEADKEVIWMKDFIEELGI